MTAGLVAGLGVAVAFRRGQWLPRIAIALTDAAGALLAVAELRQVNGRQRNTN